MVEGNAFVPNPEAIVRKLLKLCRGKYTYIFSAQEDCRSRRRLQVVKTKKEQTAGSTLLQHLGVLFTKQISDPTPLTFWKPSPPNILAKATT